MLVNVPDAVEVLVEETDPVVELLLITVRVALEDAV